MKPQDIPLDRLQAHPANSNVMPEPLLNKLVAHICDTDRYPPVIVRPLGDAYQIIDGHHRVIALQSLGRASAMCVVWDVDDAEALLLLATLNRLQGQDDPRKRASLMGELQQTFDLKKLTARLPEDAYKLKKLLQLNETMPPPRPPQDVNAMPVSLHFFLLPQQRREVEQRLRDLGGTREQALMSLIQGHQHNPDGGEPHGE